jgi:hypothetical protein
MKNIKEFRIEYYGEPFLKDENIQFTNELQAHRVPVNLDFNSPWRIIHDCSNCGEEVEFIENSQKPERNYNTIKNINSNYRNIEFLNEVCSVFPNLELIELEGIRYVNRIDFDYQFDLQRKSSVELKYHICKSCNSPYLSIIRIGYPLEAEKGIKSRFGGIEVIQITNLDEEHILIKNR